MRRADRLLIVAAALSVALHAALVGGLPGFDFAPLAEPATVPLEARLLPPPVAAAPLSPPATEAPLSPPATEAPLSPPVTEAQRRQPLPTARPAARAQPRPLPAPGAVRESVAAVPAVAAEPPRSDAAPEAGPAAAAGPAADDTAAKMVAASALEAPAAAAPAVQSELAVAPAEYPLRKVRLVYDLFHSSSKTRVGSVVHTFQTDGARYEAEAVAEAVGFVSLVFRGRFVQRSRGLIGPDGLVPEEYTLERGRGDPPERATFDWDDGRLDLAWRDERRSVALPPGAQDPISVLHQIFFMRPMPPSSRLRVASGRKLGDYVYEVLGDEDLLTPMGLVRTLHIGRVEHDGSVLEVWLDRERNLLPVRIYSVDRKGTMLDQVVREAALLE